MDNKHKFSTKVICLTDQKDRVGHCAAAFGSEADVYQLRREPGNAPVLYPAGKSRGSPLEHPLTGPTVLALYEDTPEGLADEVAAIWQDAGLPVPGRAKIGAPEAGLAGVSEALLKLQSQLVTDAMRRNASLLTQIAALRQRCEDLNTQVSGLRDVMALNQTGSHRLLHEPKSWSADITLKPGQHVVQRLPVVILPSLIGAVSASVRAQGYGQITARLTSVEDNTVQEETVLDLSPGTHVLFMPLQTSINPNLRLLDIAFENTGETPIALQQGLQESPEEAARVDGQTPQDDTMRSIRLGVWSHGAGATSSYKTTRVRRQLASWDVWRNQARPLTPGFEAREWVARRGWNALLVHPLPDAFSVASCPVKAKPEPFNGVQVQVTLPERAFSVIRLRLILTETEPKFATAEEAAAYALADTSGDEIARSPWTQIIPGCEQPVSLVADRTLEEGYMIVALTTDGHPVDHGHLTLTNLHMIIEDDSV